MAACEMCGLRRNPAHADVFVSASGDNSVKVWDLRQSRATLSLAAHAYEILVRPCTLASIQICMTLLRLSRLG